MTLSKTTRIAAAVLACGALLGASLPAQVKVGDKAPAVEAKKLLNTKMRSLGETKGRVVLYEFFAYW